MKHTTPNTVEERVKHIMSCIPKMKVTVDVGDGEADVANLEETLPYELEKAFTQTREQAIFSGRESIIKIVEDTIAEFGDQGIECVAGILEESFNGQKEVEY